MPNHSSANTSDPPNSGQRFELDVPAVFTVTVMFPLNPTVELTELGVTVQTASVTPEQENCTGPLALDEEIYWRLNVAVLPAAMVREPVSPLASKKPEPAVAVTGIVMVPSPEVLVTKIGAEKLSA